MFRMYLTERTTQPKRIAPTLSWFAICLGWVALGLINATQVVVGMRAIDMRHNWSTLFFVSAVSWLVWACATPLVLALGRRFSPTRAGGWRGWALHGATCLFLGIADACWVAALEYFLNPFAEGPYPSYRIYAIRMFYSRFHLELITYAAILAAGYTIDSMRRLALREADAARLSAELSKAQLDALRRQLEPHFLFNSLNGISGLVRSRENDAAVDMIAGLSDLLRRVLEDSGSQLVPLAEELSFLERYVELQSMRFGDRLSVTVDIPFALYSALVPGLILQPLVENAILHGIERRVEGGSIRIGAQAEGSVLTLYVHNDGPALSAAAPGARSGVGLSNTRGRLDRLYGSAGTIELRNHDEAGVETIVQVPYRT